jgi:hypothetical protein
MTDAADEIDTQIALNDYRQRVLRREPITPTEYRALIVQLQRNSVSRAAAMAVGRRKTKAGGEAKAPGKPIDLMELFGGSGGG